MSAQTIGWWIFGIQSGAYFIVCCLLPFFYVLRSGRFWRGVFFVWGTSVALVFGWDLLGQYLRLHVDKTVADYCFDGPHVLAFVLCGWWPGIVVCSIAILIYRLRERLRKKQEVQSHETAA